MEDSHLADRHHMSAGGADDRDGIYAEGHVDLRIAKNKTLSPGLAAKVLVPLCRFDLARHFQDYMESTCGKADLSARGASSLAWSGLQQAGFKQYVCKVRGAPGSEEIVVVLPEGSVSWPVRQLTPESADFLEVQAF